MPLFLWEILYLQGVSQGTRISITSYNSTPSSFGQAFLYAHVLTNSSTQFTHHISVFHVLLVTIALFKELDSLLH